MRLLPSAVVVLSTLCAAPAAATRGSGPPADPGLLCGRAIATAEREHRLPAALLHAIGRVESGRPDPRTGAAVSWPWTINAEGQGRFFETKEAAIAAVRALRARGVTVVDVGCMQVNLHHHPRAFASLEEAFDPAANARYAGLFLARLRQGARDWETAAARYHSRTPERAEAYKLKVLAAWPGMARRASEERRRVAEEQRRDAMIAAWGGGERAAPRGDGFHSVALGLSEQWPRGSEAAGRGLLDPEPERPVPRRATAPRAGRVAEASRRR